MDCRLIKHGLVSLQAFILVYRANRSPHSKSPVLHPLLCRVYREPRAPINPERVVSTPSTSWNEKTLTPTYFLPIGNFLPLSIYIFFASFRLNFILQGFVKYRASIVELLQIGGKFCKEKYHERSARQSRAFVRRASVNPPLIRINVYPWTSGGTNPVHPLCILEGGCGPKSDGSAAAPSGETVTRNNYSGEFACWFWGHVYPPPAYNTPPFQRIQTTHSPPFVLLMSTFPMRVNLDREKKFRFDSNFHPGLQFIPTTVYARVGLIPTLVSIHVAINRQHFRRN